MIWSCDLILPAETRYLSEKYRVLSRYLEPYKLPLAYALEVAALLHTPGITANHVAIAMRWSSSDLAAARMIAAHYPDERGQLNAESITLDDGRALMQAMLDARPNWACTVPLYSTRYLQARRHKKATSIQLAAEFKTTPQRIQRWWSADVFDPLSGKARPKGSTYRNKPILRRQLRAGVAM